MALLAVNFGEPKSVVQKAATERGYTFPVLLDESGIAKNDFQVLYRPATFLIGPDGKVRGLWAGLMSTEAWNQELSK